MLREDARRLGLREASDRLEAAWANIRAQAAHVPYADHPAIADPALPRYVRDWFAHREPGRLLDEHGHQRAARSHSRFLRCTSRDGLTLILKAPSRAILRLRSGAGSEFARENQYLIAGPWVHIPWGDRVGDANLGEAANLDTDAMLLRWFDHWLKDAGISRASRGCGTLRLARTNGAARRSGRRMPRMRFTCTVREMPIRARATGALSKDAPSGDEPRDVFVYDPEVPVAAPGGPQALSGAFDQSAMELGNNLLVYTSRAGSARDGDIRAAAHHAVCGDLRGACGLHGQAGASYGKRAGGVFVASGLRAVPGCFAMQAMRRTRFMRGSSRWSRLRLCLRPASGCGWRLRVRHFRSTTAILPPIFRRSLRTTGTGPLDAAGAAHRSASFRAVSSIEGRAGMVTETRGRFRRSCSMA